MTHAHGSIAEAIAALMQSKEFRQWKPPHARRTLPAHIERSDLLKDERHFTPQELADIWQVSVQTIREIFQNEEGVLKIGRDSTRTRRRYKTLRIPESVVERVHTRLSA